MSSKVDVILSNAVLDALNDGFASAPEPVPYGSVPDGDYIADFIGVETRTTAKEAIPVIDLNFRITGPREEFIGAEVRSQFFLRAGDTRNLEYFKKAARAMGIKSNIPSEVLTEMTTKVGMPWRLRVKNNDRFSNVYVNGRA